jgi:hypothetical protein
VNPTPDPAFENQIQQFRNDTRVCYHECGGYFLPSLVISDGTPRNETQFLCEMQTMNAIEKFAQEQEAAILMREGENILYREGFSGLRNDVWLRDLEPKPTLLVNLLQYTPPDWMLNLINGKQIAISVWRR